MTTPAERSLWWWLLVGGAALAGVSALIGTSMLSVGHVLGSVAAALGLLGLARREQLQQILVYPTRRVFLGLWLWVGAGYLVQIWVYSSGGLYISDLRVFNDLLSNLALRGSYYSAQLERHGFADHFTPSLMLLAPLFRLHPSPLWLLGLKWLGFMACPWLLHALGREILGPRSRCLWVLPCLWLLHTVLAYAMLFEFQPSILAPALILFSFLMALRGRWGWLVASLLLTAGLKENLPLVGVSVGCFLMVERQRLRGGALLALAFVTLGLAIFFLGMPLFGEGKDLLQPKRFGPWSYWPQKISVVAVLLASVGGLPLLRPRVLLFVLPIFGVHFASGFQNPFGFRHHYQAAATSVLFVASLYGLQALEQGQAVWAKLGPRQRQFGAATIAAALIGLNGMLPWYSARLFWPTPEARARVAELPQIRDQLGREQLPPDQPLVTTGNLALGLAPRPNVILFRKPLPDWLLRQAKPHSVLLDRQPTAVIPPKLHARLSGLMDDLVAAGSYTARDLNQNYRLYSTVP